MLTLSQHLLEADSAGGSPACSSALQYSGSSASGNDAFLRPPNFLDAPSHHHNRHSRYCSADGNCGEAEESRRRCRRRSAGGRRPATPIGPDFDHNPALGLGCYRSPLLRRRSPSIIRLNENKHFHYDTVELGPITVRLCVDYEARAAENSDSDLLSRHWNFSVDNGVAEWLIRRTIHELAAFDRQLHRCVFERRHSRLVELAAVLPALVDGAAPLISASASSASTSGFASSFSGGSDGSAFEALIDTMNTYLERLSQLTGSLMTCYPVLKFLELDSRGNHFVPIESTSINTPAIAVAIVVRDFDGRLPDQLNLRVGDIVSVVEMGTELADGRCFWRGKLTVPRASVYTQKRRRKSERRNVPTVAGGKDSDAFISRLFQVGSFPRECVRIFTGKLDFDATPTSGRSSRQPTPPPSSVNGSVRSCSGVKSRMSRWQSEKRRPLIKSLLNIFLDINDNSETSTAAPPSSSGRVFGVDLQAHLRESARELPFVLSSCINVIENHGIVTGIYRQCGIQSNIRRLRWEFDNGLQPNLLERGILCDIHCVASLLKQYFRQLPDPLFTYAIYDDLLRAYGRMDGGCAGNGQTSPAETVRRIYAIQEVVRRLPNAHFRTAICLMNHLSRISKFQDVTDMTASNLAIVWAPNLLRSPPQKDAAADDAYLLLGLDVHKSLCTFLITHAAAIFGLRQQLDAEEVARNSKLRAHVSSSRPTAANGDNDGVHDGSAPKFVALRETKDYITDQNQNNDIVAVRKSTPSCSVAESPSCQSSDGINKSVRWRRGGGVICDFGRSVRDSIIQPLRRRRQTSVITASRDETLPITAIIGKMAALSPTQPSSQTLNGILSQYNDKVAAMPQNRVIKHSSVSPSFMRRPVTSQLEFRKQGADSSPLDSSNLLINKTRRHNSNYESGAKSRTSILIPSNFTNLEENRELKTSFFEHFSRENNTSDMSAHISDPRSHPTWDRMGLFAATKIHSRQISADVDINNNKSIHEKTHVQLIIQSSPRVIRTATTNSPNECQLKTTSIEISSSESLPLDVSRYDNVATPSEKATIRASALRIQSRVRNARRPRPMSTPLAGAETPPFPSDMKNIGLTLPKELANCSDSKEWKARSQLPQNFSAQITTSHQKLNQPKNDLYYF